jgi:hypothetical protein
MTEEYVWQVEDAKISSIVIWTFHCVYLWHLGNHLGHWIRFIQWSTWPSEFDDQIGLYSLSNARYTVRNVAQLGNLSPLRHQAIRQFSSRSYFPFSYNESICGNSSSRDFYAAVRMWILCAWYTYPDSLFKLYWTNILKSLNVFSIIPERKYFVITWPYYNLLSSFNEMKRLSEWI